MSNYKLLFGMCFILVLVSDAFIVFGQSSGDSFQRILSEWQNKTELKNASIGIAISDFKSGEILHNLQPHLSLVPASVLKIVTTATALEVLGPDFRFKTILSNSGFVRNDTLFGNLEIIGGGDPTLGSRFFPEKALFLETWIAALNAKNIKVVSGNLVLDDGIFEKNIIPDTWVWEDLGNYYGAVPSGLSVFDNLYEIHLNSENLPDKPTAITEIWPEVPGLQIKNEVLSSDIKGDQSSVYGGPLELNRVISGTIPKDRSDFAVKASVPDPPALLASEFIKKLASAGIKFSGNVSYEKADVRSIPISVIQSPTLHEIIKITNHESVNLYAEHLLKYLSYLETGLGTTIDGCKFIEQFWKEKGIDTRGFYMVDGSGLSRFNCITANQLISVLNYMGTSGKYSAFFNSSLPTAGSGTLTSFSAQNFPTQSLRAKSGSMTRVRSYAGFLNCISGRQLSFVVMLNNFSCSQSEAIKMIEKMLVELKKL
jgi:D-alanyl-D-alanine carboxypeptidase/D-alanyl-D-alanine-endopeptidase (penicillin-binding protein 4)